MLVVLVYAEPRQFCLIFSYLSSNLVTFTNQHIWHFSHLWCFFVQSPGSFVGDTACERLPKVHVSDTCKSTDIQSFCVRPFCFLTLGQLIFSYFSSDHFALWHLVDWYFPSFHLIILHCDPWLTNIILLYIGSFCIVTISSPVQCAPPGCQMLPGEEECHDKVASSKHDHLLDCLCPIVYLLIWKIAQHPFTHLPPHLDIFVLVLISILISIPLRRWELWVLSQRNIVTWHQGDFHLFFVCKIRIKSCEYVQLIFSQSQKCLDHFLRRTHCRHKTTLVPRYNLELCIWVP